MDPYRRAGNFATSLETSEMHVQLPIDDVLQVISSESSEEYVLLC